MYVKLKLVANIDALSSTSIIAKDNSEVKEAVKEAERQGVGHVYIQVSNEDLSLEKARKLSQYLSKQFKSVFIQEHGDLGGFAISFVWENRGNFYCSN